MLTKYGPQRQESESYDKKIPEPNTSIKYLESRNFLSKLKHDLLICQFLLLSEFLISRGEFFLVDLRIQIFKYGEKESVEEWEIPGQDKCIGNHNYRQENDNANKPPTEHHYAPPPCNHFPLSTFSLLRRKQGNSQFQTQFFIIFCDHILVPRIRNIGGR